MPLTPFPSSMAGPQERDRLAAVLDRVQNYNRANAFQNWLEREDPEDLSTATQQTPLAAQAFLYYHASDIGHAIPDHLISIALAIVEKYGWDVNRQGHFPSSSRNDVTVTEDETFLEWLVVHEGDGTSSLPQGLQWPTTLDAFVRLDGEHHFPRNQEWLIALTVASGANPWTMQRGTRRHCAFEGSLFRGHPEIAVQLLSLPGAPSLREALDTPRPFFPETTLAEYLIGEDHRLDNSKAQFQTHFLNLLRAHPDFRFTTAELGNVSFPLFAEALKVQTLSPGESSELSQTFKALQEEDRHGPIPWLQRLALLPENRQHWTPEHLIGKEACAVLNTLLGSPCTPRPSSARQQTNRGTSWLTHQASIGGPMAGHWSVFNGYMCAQVMNASERPFGTGGLPLRLWLQDPEKNPHRITKNYPTLAALVDEDLSNGLSVRGVWALALLGKHSYSKKSPSTTDSDAPVPRVNTNELEEEACALCIPDLETFFEDGRKAAVEATEWLLTHVDASEAKKARQSLTRVWARCLDRFPLWMEACPELLARVLHLLSEGQYILWNDTALMPSREHRERYPWASLLCQLQQQLMPVDWWSTSLSQETPEALALTVEILLGTHHPQDLDRLSDWLEETPVIPAQALTRILQWQANQGGVSQKLAGNPEYRLEQKHLNRLRAAVMKHQLPDATATHTKQRF